MTDEREGIILGAQQKLLNMVLELTDWLFGNFHAIKTRTTATTAAGFQSLEEEEDRRASSSSSASSL